jgi:hypothetical protein
MLYYAYFCNILYIVTLILNGSLSSFHYCQIMNAFGSLGHMGCIFMIKLSKITVKIRIESPLFYFLCSLFVFQTIILFSLFRKIWR